MLSNFNSSGRGYTPSYAANYSGPQKPVRLLLSPRVWPLALILFALQLTTAIIMQEPLSAAAVGIYITSALEVALLNALFLEFTNSRFTRVLSMTLLLILISGFQIYHFMVGEKLHFSVILFAADELFNAQGLSFVLKFFNAGLLAGLGGLVFLIALFDYQRTEQGRLPLAKLSILLAVLLTVNSFLDRDHRVDFDFFVRSVFEGDPDILVDIPEQAFQDVKPYLNKQDSVYLVADSASLYATPHHTLHTLAEKLPLETILELRQELNDVQLREMAESPVTEDLVKLRSAFTYSRLLELTRNIPETSLERFKGRLTVKILVQLYKNARERKRLADRRWAKRVRNAKKWPSLQPKIDAELAERAAKAEVDSLEALAYAKRKPHVFMILIESFSPQYLELTETQIPEHLSSFIPVFDSVAKTSLSTPLSFSGSMVTIEGQFSSLCSAPSSWLGNTFYMYPKEYAGQCLPSYLESAGYESYFMKGYENVEYQGAGDFARSLGFSHVIGMDAQRVSEKERDDHFFNWGVKDSLFYEKGLAYIDSVRAQDPEKPVFATFTTITSHMPFHMPEEYKKVFPESSKKEQNFANSIYLADEYLQAFFNALAQREEYKDAIVIITGDHGNTMSGFPGQFRSPLLIQVPTYLALETPPVQEEVVEDSLQAVDSTQNALPEFAYLTELSKTAVHQMDIAPTILRYLGYKTPTHFWGRSLLPDLRVETGDSAEIPAEPSTSFLPMVRAYGDHKISAMAYPWQLVYNIRTDVWELYDVELDAAMTENRWHDYVTNNGPIKKRKSSPIDRDAVAGLKQDIFKLLAWETLLSKKYSEEN